VKRLTAILTVLAAALSLAACGGGSEGGVEDALSFVDRKAPFVMTVDTDSESEQWKNADKLLGKFPFAGRVKSEIKDGIEESSEGKVEWDRDIEPVLGNDLVFALQEPPAPGDAQPEFVAAMKVDDEDKAVDLIETGGGKKDGKVGDADLYVDGDSAFMAIVDGVLVFAGSRDDLESAVKRHDDDEGMSEADFDDLMAGVDRDALMRFGYDFDLFFSAASADQPELARLKENKLFAAIGKSGQDIAIEEDGISSESRSELDGSLSEEELPLATGAESPAIVRRAGEIGVGIRNPAQTIKFAEEFARTVYAGQFPRYEQGKQRVAKQLGIDVDRELIDQFDGDATVSVSLDGGVAFRSALRDPAAFSATLKKVAPRLEKLRKGEDIGVSTPPGSGDGLYAIARPGGQQLVFGVVDDNFVVATDAERAAQVGGQSPSKVEGAEGALVLSFDSRTVANEVLRRNGQGTAAQLVTGALGDFTAWTRSETDAISGGFKLTIK
jgi:hypothetical protein